MGLFSRKNNQNGPDEEDDPIPEVLQDEVFSPQEMRYLREMIEQSQLTNFPPHKNAYNDEIDYMLELRKRERENK